MFTKKKKRSTISTPTNFENPVHTGFDHLALFKEINEFVSFHELLEPLSPYSSDSDSDDHSTKISLFNACTTRVKTRHKNVSNIKPKDPSDDKLFQMLARGNRKKARDPSLNQQISSSFVTNFERDSLVNEDSIKTGGEKNSAKGGPRMRKQQQGQQQQSPENDFPLLPCATSSLQQQQQQHQNQLVVNGRSALVKFKSLQISERSYFNTHDKGLSKYPNYFDYVDNIKKPFKQIDDMPCGPSSSNHNSIDSVGVDFNCTINPPSPDLNPDILSALNSCLYSTN